jgi:hypothetical protein
MRAARVSRSGSPVLRRAVRDGCCGSFGRQLVGRLGDQWTLATLLAHLTGEDPRQPLQTALIRHLAAHLDQGLAAWQKPGACARVLCRLATERRQRLGLGTRRVRRRAARYRATARRSAAGDQPTNCCASASTKRAGETYLQRLALELPGWAGMFHWRESHPAAGDPPVSVWAIFWPYAWCSSVCMANSCCVASGVLPLRPR